MLQRTQKAELATIGIAFCLLAAGCGGGAKSTSPPEPPSATPPSATNTGPQKPVSSEPADTPTSTPSTTDSGPQEPYSPNIIPGHCGDVVDQTTAIIAASSNSEPNAHAYRALAKLCLGQEASDDLALAQANIDQLTPQAKMLITAVVAAGTPTGQQLLEVVRANVAHANTPSP